MCYHISLAATADELAGRYEAEASAVSDFKPTYHSNGFEFRNWPILTTQQPDSLQYMQWGLLPQWVKEGGKARQLQSSTLNARCETLHEKPAFRESYRNSRRCLIPTTGFFEWQKVGKKKYPYFISLTKQPIFSFAGLWDEWADQGSGEIIRTFTLITIPANPLMARIHNTKERMPAVLSQEIERKWLDPNLPEAELNALLDPISDSKMKVYTVKPLGTADSPGENSRQLIEPYNYPELSNPQQSLF